MNTKQGAGRDDVRGPEHCREDPGVDNAQSKYLSGMMQMDSHEYDKLMAYARYFDV